MSYFASESKERFASLTVEGEEAVVVSNASLNGLVNQVAVVTETHLFQLAESDVAALASCLGGHFGVTLVFNSDEVWYESSICLYLTGVIVTACGRVCCRWSYSAFFFFFFTLSLPNW